MTLLLARENWLFPPLSLSPRLSSRAIGRPRGREREGVFPRVFFIRFIFDVNYLTTTPSELQVISIGPPESRSSVFDRS